MLTEQLKGNQNMSKIEPATTGSSLKNPRSQAAGNGMYKQIAFDTSEETFMFRVKMCAINIYGRGVQLQTYLNLRYRPWIHMGILYICDIVPGYSKDPPPRGTSPGGWTSAGRREPQLYFLGGSESIPDPNFNYF